MEIPVELSKILITEHGEQQLVFLKETGGDRTFPIVIGISEALAIDRRLKGIPTPRPMTHDLLANTIDALGGSLERIVINDLREHTFYARLHIRTSGGVITVDSRPSDAIALGVGLDTPLFVSERVFESVNAGEPATREERLDILRQRLDMLTDQIDSLQAMLQDEDFLNSASGQTVNEYQKHLREMEQERQAIEDLLDKYD